LKSKVEKKAKKVPNKQGTAQTDDTLITNKELDLLV
jgi:hypothetical protein